MKRTPRSNRRNDGALLWLACLVGASVGYYIVFGILGGALELQSERLRDLSSVTLTHVEMLAQRPLLERRERAADDRMRLLALRADPPTTVARFIHATAHIVARHNVQLSQIDEHAAAAVTALPAVTPAAAESASSATFSTIPLDVTLRGDYPELLATIRELATIPLTMQIEIAAIERSAATGASHAPLTARLHINLERLVDEAAPPPTIRSVGEMTNHARSL